MKNTILTIAAILFLGCACFAQPCKIASGAAIGNTSTWQYPPTSLTLNHPVSGESLTANTFTGSPGGAHVYMVDSVPLIYAGTCASGIMNPMPFGCSGSNNRYFGVFVVGGTAPTYTVVYNYNANPWVTPANESSLVLYKRNNNSVSLWSNAGAILDTTANTLTITAEPGSGAARGEYILGIPSLSITASSTQALCNSNTGSATANVSGGTSPYTYLWSSGGTGATVNNLFAGTYTVTVTDTNGCTANQSVVVTFSNLLLLTISSTQTDCAANNGTASATPNGGTTPYTYSWSNGQTTQTATGLDTGNYTVTVTDSNACTATQTINLTQTSGPVVTLTAASTNIIYGESTQLIVTGGVTYQWSPVTGLSCTNCPNPTAAPEETITYTVTAVDSNGCVAGENITIYVEYENVIFVPNIFSPNGDDNNDMLYVRGKGVVSLIFIVYDRWGEKVFETTDLNHGWDGKFRGIEINNATFVYYLQATFVGGKEVTQEGDITLIR